MDVRAARSFGDTDIAVVRQARDDRVRRMRFEMGRDGTAVARIDGKRRQVRRAVRAHDRFGRSPVHVAEIDPVAARLGQQSGNQRADLPGAQYENPVHY